MSTKLTPRPEWVPHQDEYPVTAEGMAEWVTEKKAAADEYAEFIARGVRVLAYLEVHLISKRKPILNRVRTA